jgi:methyl-accepting chemotaxis protein
VRHLANLRLWKKLLLVGATLVVPLVVAVWLLEASLADQVEFTSAELDGVPALQGVEEAVSALATYRGTLGAAAGRADLAATLPALRADADRRFAELSASMQGATAALRADAERVAVEWQAAKSVPDAQADVALERVDLMLLDLNAKVLDASKMAFDPEPASYYLIIAGGQELPALESAIGASVSAASAALLARDDPRRLADAAREHANMAGLLRRMESAIDGASKFDPALGQRLAPAVAAFHPAMDAYLELIGAGLLERTRADVTPAALAQAASTLSERIDVMHDALLPELQALLQQRHDAQFRHALVMLGIVILVLLAAITLATYVTRTITRPIGRAVELCGAIADGRYDNAIEATTTEEAGQLLRSLAAMQERLRAQIESERAFAAEMARIKQALDSSSAAVMVADPAGTIIYCNRSADRLFREVESDFRRELPRFSADAVVGSPCDAFLANAGVHPAMLQRLAQPHRAEFTLGGRVMTATASPIAATDGSTIGAVVELVDRTAEVAIERELEQVVGAAAAGELDRRVLVDGKRGFHLTMGEQANRLLDTTGRVIADLQRVFTALAAGRLTERVTAEYQGAYAELKGAANATVDRLGETVQQIQLAADLVSSGAQELARGNENLSQRTEEQASSLEETASSMEEMTSTVKHNADNASQANQLAGAARGLARKGGDVVGRAITAMGAINDSSRRIEEIIGVIDEIAFQTNLLALNAAVEAARAGEQGRGFAVVATEVRNLASRSAGAAKQIKQLIEESVRKVDDGSRLVDESGRTLEEIVAAVQKVTDLVAEISAASREQAVGVEEVNKAVLQMDEMTQQNAALVEEAAAATEALTDQAQSLARLVAYFDLGVAAARPRAEAPTPRAARAVPPAASRARAPRLQAVAATSAAGADDPEWERF